LTELQAQAWDPVVEWAAKKLGARFILVEGVVFAAQPEEAVAAAAKAIPTEIWRLGAVNSVTSLTGSALLALAMSQDAITPDQAWAAAHVDEDWQMAQWGRDALAMERRAYRQGEMDAAAKILSLMK
jgi:chaperone required for assembly of F1-ATPase